jgi:hypothetical protein
MATIVAATPRCKKRALAARRRPLFNPTGAKTPLAKDDLHNTRASVVVRIGMGRKAPFCSQ